MRNCPFCAEEIQDAAIVCKHCRRDLTPTPPAPRAGDATQSPWAAGLTLIVLAYAGWQFLGPMLRSPFASPSESSSSVAATASYDEVSPNALYDEYKRNEVAADRSYKGRRVSVRATIDRIGKDFLDNPYVVLRVPGESVGGLHAEFDSAATVARYYPGQSVEVKCTVDGKIVWDVILRHCS